MLDVGKIEPLKGFDFVPRYLKVVKIDLGHGILL